MNLTAVPGYYPLLGKSTYIGVWLAPNLCSIAEFSKAKADTNTLLWHECFEYNTQNDLFDQVRSIIKKRFLKNRVVFLALSTPDLYAVAGPFEPEKPLEDQNILPIGLQWDSVESSVLKKAEKPVFACLRQADADYWVKKFVEAGLLVATIVPAGILWERFFKAQNNVVSCTLPQGILSQDIDKGVYNIFVPSTESRVITGAGPNLHFNCPMRPEYAWCPTVALMALEPVLLHLESPEFNCNAHSYNAFSVLRTEQVLWSYIRYIGLPLVALVALILLWAGISNVATTGLVKIGRYKQDLVAQVESIKNQNAKLQNTKVVLSALVEKKYSIANNLYALGTASSDSLWLSEVNFEVQGSLKVSIIGHAYTESAINRFAGALKEHNSFNDMQIEYTERLLPDVVSRLSGTVNNNSLFRFKCTK